MAAAFRRVAPNDARLVLADDAEAIWPALEGRLLPGSAILLKASRGIRLERLVPHLERWAATSA
jgi:UDP-N-acetylmuramoyl-tripeptide--D-alanyl-D-alanine ligase